MKKILDTVSEKMAKEATDTLDKGLKRMTTAEKLAVLGLALIGLSAISAAREPEKGQKDPKRSS